jgi:hypothetical protein
MQEDVNSNCRKCREYFGTECVEKEGRCICKDCPRNLGKCIVTRWCSETESALEY